MAESAAERTEEATPKRLQDARKKGQVPRSSELSIAAVCIAGSAAIYLLGRIAVGQFADLMHDSLSLSPAAAMSEGMIWPTLSATGARALWILLPLLGATLVAALAAPIAIGGWNFSGQALVPQFSRLKRGVIAPDHLVFQALEPLPACRRRQRHARRDFRIRQSAIGLQKLQDCAIGVVQLHHFTSPPA